MEAQDCTIRWIVTSLAQWGREQHIKPDGFGNWVVYSLKVCQ